MELQTMREVIDQLGGPKGVADICGIPVERLYGYWHNPKMKRRFPSKHYIVMERELKRRGLYASPALWGMTPPADVGVWRKRRPF